MNDIRRVLIVDDDRDFAKALESLIKNAGYEAVCAYGGIGALEELELSNPAVVILDIVMPDIDGRRVIRHIRNKLGNEIPVIIVTCLTDEAAKMDLLMEGANEFLTKPVHPEDVMDAVDRLVNG